MERQIEFIDDPPHVFFPKIHFRSRTGNFAASSLAPSDDGDRALTTLLLGLFKAAAVIGQPVPKGLGIHESRALCHRVSPFNAHMESLFPKPGAECADAFNTSRIDASACADLALDL